MDRRDELQGILESLCPNVYFQPPENKMMQYPAIAYEPMRGKTEFANNKPYRHTRQYELTLITEDPDDETYGRLAGLPMTVHDRFFVADNLNHHVFNIYF